MKRIERVAPELLHSKVPRNGGGEGLRECSRGMWVYIYNKQIYKERDIYVHACMHISPGRKLRHTEVQITAKYIPARGGQGRRTMLRSSTAEREEFHTVSKFLRRACARSLRRKGVAIALRHVIVSLRGELLSCSSACLPTDRHRVISNSFNSHVKAILVLFPR